MQLMDVHRFAEQFFAPDSRPADITLQRWMRSGKLPGRKIGKAWYVDVHAFLADNQDPEVSDLIQRVLDGNG